MSGSTAQPDSGCGIQWKVILEGHCNVNGFTVNAPGDPYDGSYLTEEAAALWATFTKQNETPVSQTGDAAVTIRNDQAGNLSDVGTVEMGTDDAPFLVQGDPDENFSITLYYGGNAGVELQALRHEVEVGGLAFAGNFDGSISAWQVAPGGTATLLKQANSTDDALWDIK